MDDVKSSDAAGQVRVGVRELRGNLTGYLRQVAAGGSVLVTSHDRVIAELRAPAGAVRADRRPGALAGKIRMADDFDAMPDEVLAAMEG
jgi:antitoxin (DNA-binding transcriptional repressor) of toxin-antitoxin stability system